MISLLRYSTYLTTVFFSMRPNNNNTSMYKHTGFFPLPRTKHLQSVYNNLDLLEHFTPNITRLYLYLVNNMLMSDEEYKL